MKLSSVLVAAVAFSVALPASATVTLNVTKGGYFNNATVTVAGPGPGNGNQIAANFRPRCPGGGAFSGSFDLLAFCVDLAHTIGLGNNTLATLSPSLNYQIGTLTTAPGGGALTPSQIQQMQGLASLGFQLIKTGAPNLSLEIPAIQSAIWSIEYGKTITSSNPLINTKIANYIAIAPTLTGKATYIFSTDSPVRQGLFISYVPEPGTWAMLIAGFGLLGVAARRRRAEVARAAA